MRSSNPRHPIAVALCLVALASPLAVLAGPPGPDGGPGRMEDRLDRMTEELKLTPDQQTQIRKIVEEQQAAMDRQRQETRQRIDAVLTEAQRADRDRLLDQRLERRLERLADRLDLSADQTAQIRTIMKERREDPDLDRGEVRERIQAVLTEQQRKQMDDQAERRGGRDCGPKRGPGPGL